MSASPQHPTTPRLYVILDHGSVGDDDRWAGVVGDVASAVDSRAGVMLQLRVKERRGEERLRLLERGWQRARDHDVPVLTNGSVATARRVGCHGAHWPEARIPDPEGDDDGPYEPGSGAGDAPVGGPLLRAASVHSIAAARRALAAGARFGVFAPVFAPRSKVAEPRGLEALATVAMATDLPILALGGVNASRVATCLENGATGVAAVGAVVGSDDPGTAALGLLDAVDVVVGGAP